MPYGLVGGKEQPVPGGVSERAVRLSSAGGLARVSALLMTLSYTTPHRHSERDALTVKVTAGTAQHTHTCAHDYTHTYIGNIIIIIIITSITVRVCIYKIYNIYDDNFFNFFFSSVLNAFCQRILLLLLPFDVRVHKKPTNNYYAINNITYIPNI